MTDSALPPHPRERQCALCGHTVEWHDEYPDGTLHCRYMRGPEFVFTPRTQPMTGAESER